MDLHGPPATVLRSEHKKKLTVKVFEVLNTGATLASANCICEMRTKTDANQRICNIYLCGVTMTDTSSGPSQVDLPNGAQAPKDETMDEEDDLEKPVDFFNDEW